MIRNDLFIRNIIVFLYIFYFMQGIFYISGSILSQLSLLLILCINFFYFVKIACLKRNLFVVFAFISFFIVQCIYYVFSPKEVMSSGFELVGTVSTFGQFKNICGFLLCFFPFYFFAKKGLISDSFLQFIALLFVLFSVLQFFFMQKILLAITGGDVATNNISYVFVVIFAFIPLVLKKSKILAAFFLIIIIYFTILGAKRGAVVCLLSALILSIYYYFKLYKFKISTILTFIVTLILLGYYGYIQYLENDYLQRRLEVTYESGVGIREIIYRKLFDNWCNSQDLSTLIFGNGMSKTVSIAGNFAHNDWLELLTNNGLLGVTLYFVCFISVYIYIKKSSLDIYSKWTTYLVLVIWLLKTMFSMGYTELSNYVFMLLIGSMIGRNEYINSVSKNEKSTLLH